MKGDLRLSGGWTNLDFGFLCRMGWGTLKAAHHVPRHREKPVNHPKLALLISLCLCLFPGAIAVGEDAPVLRVLTYNIHHAEGLDQKLDLERIAKIITASKADIVMLQEVDQGTQRTNQVDQPAELARLTGMQVVFGGNLKFQGGDYGNAILSRFPIVASKNHPLPNLTEGEPRGVLAANISLPAELGGATIRVLSTHFDHRQDNRDRAASVETLKNLSRDWTEPQILGGDLNMTRENEAMRQFVVNWTLASDTERPTSPAQAPRRQIDYIAFRPAEKFAVREVRVLDEPVASDHCPLLAVIELK